MEKFLTRAKDAFNRDGVVVVKFFPHPMFSMTVTVGRGLIWTECEAHLRGIYAEKNGNVEIENLA